jgi:cytochrome c oxidase subunit 1
LPFVVNIFWSLFAGRRAPANPWQANTLEWSTASPPPHHNFDIIPVVHHGPYEYSAGAGPEDWLPQDRPVVSGSSSTA